jgi:teichuronic acid exporter
MLERASSAGLWATIEALASQGINFAVYLLLARLLLPADFGVFAIVVFFSSLIIMAINSAITQALIQRRTSSIEEESSIFWLVLIVVTVIAAVFAIGARSLASFYELPDLAPLMLVVAGQIVILSLSVVPSALLVRRLEFATIAKVSFVSAIVSGALAIAVAALEGGVWALAVQIGTSAVLTTVLTVWLCQWRPIFRVSLHGITPALRFASWVSLSGILEIIYSQGSGLVIGKAYGPQELSYFDRARTLHQLPGTFVTNVIARVALPLFAQSDHDRDALRDGVRRTSGFAMFIFLPPITLCVVLPDLVIETLVGSAWLPAAPILSVLALSSVLLPVHAINLQLLLAEGGARAYFRLEIAKKMVGITCIAIGLAYGLIGLAWGYVAASVVALVINTRPTAKSIQYGLVAQVRDLAGLLVCSAGMVAVIVLLQPKIAMSPPGSLLVLGVGGSLAYIAVGAALRLPALKEAIDIGRALLAGRRSVAAPNTQA